MIKYFCIEELVPKSVFDRRGEKAWELLDWRALDTLEWLRENLGACTVNNWKWGGGFSQSGLRTWEHYLSAGDPEDEQRAHAAISKSLSQHKYGRAFDCKFKDYTAEEARNWIKAHWDFPWAITLEEGVNWLHFDVRTKAENKVYTFTPMGLFQKEDTK